MRKGEKHHKWSLSDLCFIRDNTHKYTDREIGEKLGGFTKAQIRGARVMYGIKRRKKHNRPYGDRLPKGTIRVKTHNRTGTRTAYIKTGTGNTGWTHLERYKLLNE